MVSSICRLLRCAECAASSWRSSNLCATAEPGYAQKVRAALLPWGVAVALLLSPPVAEARQDPDAPRVNRAAAVGRFLTGALAGLGAHEAGHVFFDVVFDADPGIERVEFYGIPFFAITHREVSPRREFAISSAGFWVQHAGNEWLLTAHPRLRGERAPFRKGLLAFNVIASIGYSGAAFARTGPLNRDTRGMALSARIDERWVGALILAPAVLDAWRYFEPEAAWPVWLSRAVKLGCVLLILR